MTAKFDTGLDMLMSEMTQMQKERDEAVARADHALERLSAAHADVETLRRERDKHMRASSEWQYEVGKARNGERQLADLLHRTIVRAKARDLHPEHCLVGEVRAALASTPPSPAAVDVAGREPQGAEWLCADRYRDLDDRLTKTMLSYEAALSALEDRVAARVEALARPPCHCDPTAKPAGVDCCDPQEGAS